MEEFNDVGDGPTDDNLQGQGFADHSRQLSWQMQVQSTKYPEFEKHSLFQKHFITYDKQFTT